MDSQISYDEITDGGSNTFMLGEFLPRSDSLGWVSGTRASLRNTGDMLIGQREWTEAERKPSPAKNLVGGFGSYHPGGAQFAFAGGEVKFISQQVDPLFFGNLGNRADGAMMGDGF